MPWTSGAQRPRGPLPSVSIVVPAFDEEVSIGACLRGLAAQTVLADEVLVVDNRSTDRTAAIVRAFAAAHPAARITLLAQHTEQGLVPTRDVGFAAASGDVIGRIDADTVLDPDWVHRVRNRFRDPATAALTGPVGYYDMPLHRVTRRVDHLARRTILVATPGYPFLFGSNMAVRASALAAIRGRTCRDRDDRFHEDIDLSLHLLEAGLTIRYAPEVRAMASARRLADSTDAFTDYAGRFERTYRAHGVTSGTARFAGALLLAGYPVLHRVYARSVPSLVRDRRSVLLDTEVRTERA